MSPSDVSNKTDICYTHDPQVSASGASRQLRGNSSTSSILLANNQACTRTRCRHSSNSQWGRKIWPARRAIQNEQGPWALAQLDHVSANTTLSINGRASRIPHRHSVFLFPLVRISPLHIFALDLARDGGGEPWAQLCSTLVLQHIFFKLSFSRNCGSRRLPFA